MGVRENVMAVLETEPITRNNDEVLIIRYVERFHGVQTLTELKKLAVEGKINFDTIRRFRSEIQRSGLFQPSQPRRKYVRKGKEVNG